MKNSKFKDEKQKIIDSVKKQIGKPEVVESNLFKDGQQAENIAVDAYSRIISYIIYRM